MKTDDRIREFLWQNGWVIDDSTLNDEFISYHRSGESSIDVSVDEIVFVSDNGDWLHIPCDYYALVGAMYVHRVGFKLRMI